MRESALARQILAGATALPLSAWAGWLGAIDRQFSMAGLDDVLTTLLEQLWSHSADRPAVKIREAAAAYTDLLGDQLTPDLALTSIVITALAEPVEDDDTAADHRILLERAQLFLGSGLVDPVELARHECAALTDALELGGEKAGPDDPLLQYVTAVAAPCFTAFGHHGAVVLGKDESLAMIRAADDCVWLPEPEHTALVLGTRRAASTLLSPTAAQQGLPDAATMCDFYDSHQAAAHEPLTDWIVLSNPSAEDLLTATAPVLRSSSPSPAPALLQQIRERLTRLL